MMKRTLAAVFAAAALTLSGAATSAHAAPRACDITHLRPHDHVYWTPMGDKSVSGTVLRVDQKLDEATVAWWDIPSTTTEPIDELACY